MSEPTVYVVDDDADVRESLRWLLKTVGLRSVICASAEEFLREYREEGPACLVLDVRMPGSSGLDLFEATIARGGGLPVLFITAHADVPMAVRAMKSGAAEFLEKPFNAQVLLEKIQQALRESSARRERRAALDGSRARFETLSEKEREVLERIRAGMSNKEIATRLGVTLRAVEMRRAGLMRKLGVESLSELLRLALALEGSAGPGPANAPPAAQNSRNDA